MWLFGSICLTQALWCQEHTAGDSCPHQQRVTRSGPADPGRMKIAEISLRSLSLGFSLPNETISDQSPPLQGAYSEELENVSNVTGSVQELPENSAEPRTPKLSDKSHCIKINNQTGAVTSSGEYNTCTVFMKPWVPSSTLRETDAASNTYNLSTWEVEVRVQEFKVIFRYIVSLSSTESM